MIEKIIPKPWVILPKLFRAKLHCELNNIEVDLEKIKSEYLNILKKENFKNHSSGDFEGGWGAIGLITYGGDPYTDLVKEESELLPTRLMNDCSYIKTILDKIPGKKGRVRFMEVKPNTNVFWHYDNNETIDEADTAKNARLHLPIITSDKVELMLCNQKANWKEGKLYYGDFSFPHSIFNKSNINRIHLIIDVNVNKELLNMFPKEFLDGINKRKLIKKTCQLSCNLFKRLKIIKGN